MSSWQQAFLSPFQLPNPFIKFQQLLLPNSIIQVNDPVLCNLPELPPRSGATPEAQQKQHQEN
jgi:hypothetical protein